MTQGPIPDVAPVGSTDASRARTRGGGKRKRRRGPGGLGRGLARILVDNGSGPTAQAPGAGLVELIGGNSAARLASVEGVVLDTALRALMAAFDLRALAVAAAPHADRAGGSPIVRAVMPPEWVGERGPGAQLHRQLATLLRRASAEPDPGPISREVAIDGHRLWMHRSTEDGRALAATAVGDTPLAPGAAEALAPVIRALASSVADRGVDAGLRLAIRESTQIALKSEGDDVLAEVNADWPLPQPVKAGLRGRRTGVGRGSEPVQAVARAAAKACRPRCEVVFAGTAPVGVELDGAGTASGANGRRGPAGHVDGGPDGEVAIAFVRVAGNGYRFGWAERTRGDLGGVAEAVFTAAL